jgi:hypothetical protein
MFGRRNFMMIAASDKVPSQAAGTSQLPKFAPITALAKTVTSMSRNIGFSAAEGMEYLHISGYKIHEELGFLS